MYLKACNKYKTLRTSHPESNSRDLPNPALNLPNPGVELLFEQSLIKFLKFVFSRNLL